MRHDCVINTQERIPVTMELYKALLTQNEHGYMAYNPDFDMAVDADNVDNAVAGLKRLIEEAGILMLKSGERIPSPVALNIQPNQTAVYFSTDIDSKFKASASSSVRKNISLPSWMDIKLRTNNIDASALFQEAANAKFKEIDDTQPFVNINSLEALKSAVSEDVLKQYVKECVNNL